MTAAEWHAYLIRLAVEAGADPVRASERMAQAAQTFALLAPETAESAPLDAFSQADERRRVGAKLRERLAEGGESGRRLVRVQPVYDERFVALTGALGADVFPTGGEP